LTDHITRDLTDALIDELRLVLYRKTELFDSEKQATEATATALSYIIAMYGTAVMVGSGDTAEDFREAFIECVKIQMDSKSLKILAGRHVKGLYK
jgi:hypothetical protein